MEKIDVKICGINTPDAMQAALVAGARYAGLVFYPPSPRALAGAAGAALARIGAGRIETVALFVDPDDALLREITAAVRPDWIQLHGDETPRRAAAIREMTGAKIIKAMAIAEAADFAAAETYVAAADQFLFDAKAPAGSSLPGGNAAAFDWRLLAGRRFARPWLLAGGLTPENVREAVRLSGAAAVDVSSGVEDRPGVKNNHKITAFCAAARG